MFRTALKKETERQLGLWIEKNQEQIQTVITTMIQQHMSPEGLATVVVEEMQKVTLKVPLLRKEEKIGIPSRSNKYLDELDEDEDD